MRKTPLKRQSDKAKLEAEQWARIRLIKLEETKNTCEWCGGRGQNNEFYQLDCHHKLSRARGGKSILGNAYLCHRICHNFIHNNNVGLITFPTKELWCAWNE